MSYRNYIGPWEIEAGTIFEKIRNLESDVLNLQKAAADYAKEIAELHESNSLLKKLLIGATIGVFIQLLPLFLRVIGVKI